MFALIYIILGVCDGFTVRLPITAVDRDEWLEAFSIETKFSLDVTDIKLYCLFSLHCNFKAEPVLVTASVCVNTNIQVVLFRI